MPEMMKIADWVENIATLYYKSLAAFFLASSAGSAGYIPLTKKFCGPAIPYSYGREEVLSALKESGTTFDFKQYHYVEREDIILLYSESDFLVVYSCPEQECIVGAVCSERDIGHANEILGICVTLLKE